MDFFQNRDSINGFPAGEQRRIAADRGKFLLVFAGTLMACLAAIANERAARPVVRDIQLGDVRLTHLDTDSAEFEFAVTGTALKSITIKSIYFQKLSVNGIALHAPPIRQRIRLQEGRELADLPVLRAHVAFREVSSLQPLRDIAGGGSAHIHAELLAEIDLNPIEMFLLRTLDAWSVIELDQNQPVTLPGGVLGKAAMLAALTAAEPVWMVGNEAREWRRRTSAASVRAKEAMGNALASVDCKFMVRAKDGRTSELTLHSAGFFLASGKILTTAEGVEPWNFDPPIAEALSKHEITLVPDSVEVRVKPVACDKEFSTTRNEVHIYYSQHAKKIFVSNPKHTSYHLQLKDSDDNLALIGLENYRPQPASVRPVTIEDSEWKPAAVFYFASEPEVFLSEARLDNGRLALKEPLGPAAIGSPIWMDEGVGGIVQAEGSGATIGAVRKLFPGESF